MLTMPRSRTQFRLCAALVRLALALHRHPTFVTPQNKLPLSSINSSLLSQPRAPRLIFPVPSVTTSFRQFHTTSAMSEVKKYEPRDGDSVMSLFSLKGKTAIVTGAGAGIGYAVAEAFAEAGANVAIWYNSNPKAEERAEELSKRFNVTGMYTPWSPAVRWRRSWVGDGEGGSEKG